jgi:hypothetical protein
MPERASKRQKNTQELARHVLDAVVPDAESPAAFARTSPGEKTSLAQATLFLLQPIDTRDRSSM